jgi:hypothetical protein
MLLCFSVLLLAALPARAQTTNTGSSPIPEEARKHFVMGATLFKDARTADEFSQAESEFKQATDLAPQWPEARLNLALTREAAGNYSGAMADLKLYQQFKLSDADARAVQDKLYALEAKQKKAALDKEKTAKETQAKAARDVQTAAEHEKNLHTIEGVWFYEDPNSDLYKNYPGMADNYYVISRGAGGSYSKTLHSPDNFMSLVEFKGRDRSYTEKTSSAGGANITVSRGTLSSDGQRIEGTYTMYYPNGTVAQKTMKFTNYRKQ